MKKSVIMAVVCATCLTGCDGIFYTEEQYQAHKQVVIQQEAQIRRQQQTILERVVEQEQSGRDQQVDQKQNQLACLERSEQFYQQCEQQLAGEETRADYPQSLEQCLQSKGYTPPEQC